MKIKYTNFVKMVVYCDFIAGCFGGRRGSTRMDYFCSFSLFNVLTFFSFLGACGTMVGHPFDTIKIWQQFGNQRISHSVNEIIMRNNGVSPIIYYCII